MKSEIRTLFKALILSIFVTGCGGMNNENEPEQDEMAYDYLDLGPQYFALSSAGKPVAGGQIYIGNVNTDPEIPANQKQVQLILENGSRVNVDQPVRTGAGGVIEYNGSPAIMTTDGDYSMKVLSSNGTQVYYFSEKKATGIPSVNVQDSILLIDGTSPNPSIGYIDHPSDGIYHTGTTINIKQGGGDSPIASLDDISANSVASVSAGTNINVTGTTANPIVNVDPALVTYIDEKSAHSDSASTSPLNDCNDLYGAVGVAYQIFDEDTLNHPSGNSNVPGYGGGYIMHAQDFAVGGAAQLAYYGPSTASGSTTVRVRFFKLNEGWTDWDRLATVSDVNQSLADANGYTDTQISGVETNKYTSATSHAAGASASVGGVGTQRQLHSILGDGITLNMQDNGAGAVGQTFVVNALLDSQSLEIVVPGGFNIDYLGDSIPSIITVDYMKAGEAIEIYRSSLNSFTVSAPTNYYQGHNYSLLGSSYDNLDNSGWQNLYTRFYKSGNSSAFTNLPFVETVPSSTYTMLYEVVNEVGVFSQKMTVISSDVSFAEHGTTWQRSGISYADAFSKGWVQTGGLSQSDKVGYERAGDYYVYSGSSANLNFTTTNGGSVYFLQTGTTGAPGTAVIMPGLDALGDDVKHIRVLFSVNMENADSSYQSFTAKWGTTNPGGFTDFWSVGGMTDTALEGDVLFEMDAHLTPYTGGSAFRFTISNVMSHVLESDCPDDGHKIVH